LTEKHSAATPFDFSRLDRIPKALLRAVHHLHENFAKNVSASLAAYLRTHIAMSVVSMEQISYAEFIDGMATPTLIAYIGMRPYEGTAVMDLNTSVVFNMLETLLGGGPRPAANPARKITEVEKELMQGLLRILLRGLRDAWATVADVEFGVQFLADDPYGVRVMSPTEAVVAIGIEAQIGQTAEVINVAIPSLFVKQLRNLFNRVRWMHQTDPKPEQQFQIAELLRAVDVEMEVRLEGSSVRICDLIGLAPGDVLELDYPEDRKASGLLNGEPKFQGRLVQSGQNLAYEIDAAAVAD
jgi:flagellar motor switch protein FliM